MESVGRPLATGYRDGLSQSHSLVVLMWAVTLAAGEWMRMDYEPGLPECSVVSDITGSPLLPVTAAGGRTPTLDNVPRQDYHRFSAL